MRYTGYFKLIIEMLGPKVILCALLTLCVSHVTALDFTNSKWIWTSSAGSTSVPALAIGDFRKDFTAEPGKIPVSANIIIAGDNTYTLYVNGKLIGQGNNWQVAQGYCVELIPGCANVFAVAVQNQPDIPTPAAFITAISVNYKDGTSSMIVSDATWRASNETAEFENVGFEDSTWPYAVVVGNLNSPPWSPNYPTVPAPVECQK